MQYKDILLKGRFIGAVAGLVVSFFGERAGVDTEALRLAIGTIMAFVIGSAIVENSGSN